jgi:hypothetical protein
MHRLGLKTFLRGIRCYVICFLKQKVHDLKGINSAGYIGLESIPGSLKVKKFGLWDPPFSHETKICREDHKLLELVSHCQLTQIK